METGPNVLLVVLDTVRATHLSCYGHEEPTTPNIDAFAESATKYEFAISEGCWTVPSHASIFTGRSSLNHGSHAHNRRFTPGDSPVLAEKLSDAGYETYGASRNAWITENKGFARGFDEFDDRDHAQLFEEDFDIREAIRRHAGKSISRRYTGILSEAVTSGHPLRSVLNLAYFKYRDSAFCDDGASINNSFAERTLKQTNEPWFLFLNYMEAHEPYYKKSEHDETLLPEVIPPFSAYDESAKWDYHAGRTDPPFDALESMYEAEIRLLDDKIGNLLNILKKEEILDETLVILAGDHGQHFGENNMMAHIASPYPSGIRVPLLVSEPGQSNSQTVSKPISLRSVYDIILEHTIDRQTDELGPAISHCFGSHEDVFDDYPELDEDAWREHIATGIVDSENGKYGVVRGERGRYEVYNVANPTGPTPDVEVADELLTRLDEDLNKMIEERSTNENTEVSGRLKDLGYL